MIRWVIFVLVLCGCSLAYQPSCVSDCNIGDLKGDIELTGKGRGGFR